MKVWSWRGFLPSAHDHSLKTQFRQSMDFISGPESAGVRASLPQIHPRGGLFSGVGALNCLYNWLTYQHQTMSKAYHFWSSRKHRQYQQQVHQEQLIHTALVPTSEDGPNVAHTPFAEHYRTASASLILCSPQRSALLLLASEPYLAVSR